MSNYHIPIMCEEVIRYLNIIPDGLYVDATFGGGGHSRAILSHLHSTKGKIIVFDQDKTALEKNAIDDDRVTAVHANFIYIKHFLHYLGISNINGIIADLGVSSYQFDTDERGFSIMRDGPLDMRMNVSQTLTARKILETYSEDGLTFIFQEYGEVGNTNTLVSRICEARKKMKIETTQTLIKLIDPIAKGKNKMQYFAKVFQALRIEVNSELEHLQQFIQDTKKYLAKNGSLAVLSFHSLEDRIIKQAFQNKTHEHTDDHVWEPLFSKPLMASQEEVKMNTRARSAKLRVAKKIS